MGGRYRWLQYTYRAVARSLVVGRGGLLTMQRAKRSSTTKRVAHAARSRAVERCCFFLVGFRSSQSIAFTRQSIGPVR